MSVRSTNQKLYVRKGSNVKNAEGKSTDPKEAKTSKSSKSASVLKKLDADTAKILSSLKDQANKKPYGRRIKDGEILAVAVRLVTAEDLDTLKERSLTGQDRLRIAHEKHQQEHGKIAFDVFIGKLLSREPLPSKQKAVNSPPQKANAGSDVDQFKGNDI